jgi:hypothetical protein
MFLCRFFFPFFSAINCILGVHGWHRFGGCCRARSSASDRVRASVWPRTDPDTSSWHVSPGTRARRRFAFFCVFVFVFVHWVSSHVAGSDTSGDLTVTWEGQHDHAPTWRSLEVDIIPLLPDPEARTRGGKEWVLLLTSPAGMATRLSVQVFSICLLV